MAPRGKSRSRVATYRFAGPRSLILTTTLAPVSGLVTRTTLPGGSGLEAAVSPRGSKRSPLAVRRPRSLPPYHDANTWTGYCG